MINRHRGSCNLTAFSLLTFLSLWSALAVAQFRTRDISGTVTDHQHEPLRGAVVEVENCVSLGVVSYITDRDGRYSFRRLDGDIDYRLWVNFRGHKSRVRQLSKLDEYKPQTINFVVDLH
ncbi:carboxypeptidase-like regulatory domain-containing protein [Granulicella aggregans]|uniref:carboxypeptidase-like regulatory domain-containing protein n=1 Tax=Granulicella aggregans TaxID=474949 RepID=UPI0021DFA1BC|nr:carboxypeptidase-like regulatory domain-containing protein [Granulicella aggregans]